MDDIIDFTDLLKKDYLEPSPKEEREVLLFLLNLSGTDCNFSVLEEGKRRYAPFLKRHFSSISLSPFESGGDKNSLLLDAVKTFVLYTVGKEKAIPSLLLSFRYFLTAVIR